MERTVSADRPKRFLAASPPIEMTPSMSAEGTA